MHIILSVSLANTPNHSYLHKIINNRQINKLMRQHFSFIKLNVYSTVVCKSEPKSATITKERKIETSSTREDVFTSVCLHPCSSVNACVCLCVCDWSNRLTWVGTHG